MRCLLLYAKIFWCLIKWFPNYCVYQCSYFLQNFAILELKFSDFNFQLSLLFVVSFRLYNLKTKTTINAKFSGLGIFCWLSFICCYIICVTVPIRNGVHKTNLIESIIKHYYESIFYHHFSQNCNIKQFTCVRIDTFSDFEKHFVCSCISSTFSRHSLFLSITFTSLKIWTTLHMVHCVFRRKHSVLLTSMDHPSFLSNISLMDCFINLSVLTRDITCFFVFYFSPCNNTTTVKIVLSEVKPSRWSLAFL